MTLGNDVAGAVEDKDKNKVQLLSRALSVLFSFSAKKSKRTLDDLAAELKINKASLLRILRTLEAEKILFRFGDHYSLGPRVLELGNTYLSTLSVHEVAQPYMASLAETCDQTVSLAILDEFNVVYIAIEHAQRDVGIQGEIGGRHPAHATGLGKVLLADLDEVQLNGLLENCDLKPLTDRTITTPEALRERLEQVRREGVALDDEERGIGIRCVAAPIRDRSGKVVAGLSLAGPIFHMTDDKLPLYTERLLQSAATISEHLGYVTEPVLEPALSSETVYNLFSRSRMKASCIMAKLEETRRSQFFQSLLHFSNQEKLRSTTQRLGMTTKLCRSLRLATSTSAPSRSLRQLAKVSPV